MGFWLAQIPDWWGGEDLPRWREWANEHFDGIAWVALLFTVLLVALLAYGWGYAAGERNQRRQGSAEVLG